MTLVNSLSSGPMLVYIAVGMAPSDTPIYQVSFSALSGHRTVIINLTLVALTSKLSTLVPSISLA